MGGSVPNLEELGIQKIEGDMLHWFRNEVANLVGCSGFPGAQPVSFNRNSFKELKSRDYYVCEKSDGIRALLYFTKQHTEKGLNEMHFLIDRKNDYYLVQDLHFPMAPENPNDPIDWSSWHYETLLDGELLWDEYPDGRRELKYLVFDSLMVDGKLMLEKPLSKRLGAFIEKIYNPYRELLKQFPEDTKRFMFKIQQKSFQLAYGVEVMFKSVLPTLPHGNDGLIFTCTETPYKFKTDQNILKWKPAEENTVDFRMGIRWVEERNPATGIMEPDFHQKPVVTLWMFVGDNRDEFFDILHLTDEEWDEMTTWASVNNDGLHGQVIECHVDEKRRWRFMRFRNDKTDANHISVVKKVLESIQDGVTAEQLITAAPDIRAAWKEPGRESRRQGISATRNAAL